MSPCRVRALFALALLSLAPAGTVAGQTHLSTRLRYGASAFSEARGADAALTNPALAALGDQPRASASFLGVAGVARGSYGLLRSVVDGGWGQTDRRLTPAAARGLSAMDAFGTDPGGVTELQWFGAHSGTSAVSVQTAAIARTRWDDRTRAALEGDAAGYGVPGVIDAGSQNDLALVSTAAVAFGQGNGDRGLGTPVWWSGLSFQASYVHLRERQVGRAITVADLRDEGSVLPLDGLSDDARGTRLERLRLEGGWIWSTGLGGVWQVGRAGVFGLHGNHLLQLNRSRRAEAFVGQTTFLLADARGLQLERRTDPLTADSSDALRAAANDLAREQRWTPTVNASYSMDLNGPVRRLSLGATIPLDRRPSLDRQAREVGVSVGFASAWLPRLHYVQNAEHGALWAGAWTVSSCAVRLDVGGGRMREQTTQETRWTGQVRVSVLSRECRPTVP